MRFEKINPSEALVSITFENNVNVQEAKEKKILTIENLVRVSGRNLIKGRGFARKYKKMQEQNKNKPLGFDKEAIERYLQ